MSLTPTTYVSISKMPLHSSEFPISPTFYTIPVTSELENAVATGTYPQTPTIVQAHLPALPRPYRRQTEGMKPLDNRQILLSCFEAFKQIVN